jgi:hypothetical protein
MAASEIANPAGDVCEDCGAAVPEGKAGCQKLFEEVLVKDYSDYRYGKNHRLTVDAYSLQHPDAYMRSGKSFVAHLTGMCAAFEHEDTSAINQVVQKWLNGPRNIEKPAHLPQQRGELTISYINSAANTEEHHKRVHEWAHCVWNAWSEHHDLARRWINEATERVTGDG